MLSTYSRRFKIKLMSTAIAILFVCGVDALASSDGDSTDSMSSLSSELTEIENQMLDDKPAAAERLNALNRSQSIGSFCNKYNMLREFAKEDRPMTKVLPAVKKLPGLGAPLPKQQIVVRSFLTNPNGETSRLSIKREDTVGKLKAEIATQSGTPAESIDAFSGGILLGDDRKLIRESSLNNTIEIRNHQEEEVEEQSAPERAGFMRRLGQKFQKRPRAVAPLEPLGDTMFEGGGYAQPSYQPYRNPLRGQQLPPVDQPRSPPRDTRELTPVEQEGIAKLRRMETMDSIQQSGTY